MSTIEKIGRRHYLRNTPYSAKDRIRAAGCKWDPAERAWWTGKADVAESLVASLAGAGSDSGSAGGNPDAPGLDATVAGRAEYKGRTYYVAGRVVRDWDTSVWDEEVAPITSRDGSRILLYFRDGSRQFWAPRDAARIVKGYQRAQTIRRLREYADDARSRLEAGIPDSGSDDWQYTRDGEPGPMRGCGTCAQLGVMCESCRFDEFDN